MKRYYYDYTEKLSKVLQSAKAGKAITIGFLGGSITQGCNPSIPQNAYAIRTYEWLKHFVAPTTVNYVNAGVGATGSLIGVHRMTQDLIQYEPDIVIVEFAANDVPPTKSTRQSYESIIRRLIQALPNAAIIELFMTLQDGVSGEAQQTQIGHHYGIPMISYRQEIFNGMAAGDYTWEDIETDEVHPNDRGHGIVASLLENLMEIAMSKEVDETYHYEMPEVLFSDRYVDGQLFNHTNLKPLALGSFKETEEGFRTLKNGWTAEDGKSSFKCELQGKTIYLLYRRNKGQFKGVAEVTIDHEKNMAVDSSFENGWGDYAETLLLVEAPHTEKHLIEIKLKSDQGDFTILGFLVAGL